MKQDKNRPTKGDRSRPTLVQAVICEVAIRQFDKLVICDVVDSLGNFHKGVETIMNGGGSTDSFSSSPYQVGQEVFLIQMSHNEQPYIIGSVFKSASIVPSRDVEFSATGEDRNVIGVRDYCVANRGNFLNLTENDGVSISANKDIRLQLGAGGILRISKDGLSDDYPLKGVKFITALHDYLEEMRQIQDDMKAMLNIISGYSAAESAALKAFFDSATAGPGGLAAAATTAKAVFDAQATPHSSTTSRNTTLQGRTIRTDREAGENSAEALCTSIRLPKTPT